MAEKVKRRINKLPSNQKGFVNLSGQNISSCFQNHKENAIHPIIIKQARKSGQLNLSNRGIVDVPEVVWNINMISSEEVKSLSLSIDANEDDRWWDQVDLTKLILASNSIKSLSPEINKLGALTVLDLHDNQLENLPPTLADLYHLVRLNLGHNKLTQLPDAIFQLKELHILHLEHNHLTELSDDIGNLSLLEELDISNNHLTSLPPTIAFLTRVTSFNASNNHLADIPPEIGDMRALNTLDLAHNRIAELPDSLGYLTNLEQLYVRHNQLTSLPTFTQCLKLKEIQAGNNKITSLSEELMETLVPIRILDLRDNKIGELPDSVLALQSLERLDLTNNSLSSLPYTLGTLPNLKYLSLEGNPLRSIRRDVMQRGTMHLLKWLRSRLDESALIPSPRGNGSTEQLQALDPYAIKATHALNYCNKELSDISEEFVKLAVDCKVTSLDLSKNQLTSVPDRMEPLFEQLTELNLSMNKLQNLTPMIGRSPRLLYLNLGNNYLSELPEALANASQLKEINLSFNRFTKIPPVLYRLPKLEILLMSDNKVEEIQVEDGLANLPNLAALDLRNNNLRAVPPEMGKLTQLRTLSLEGNIFRIPQPHVLAKGTPFVLEYLRNRIPQ